MEEPDIDLAAVERLIKLVETRNLSELVVQDAGIKITVRGLGYGRATHCASQATAQPPLAPALLESRESEYSEVVDNDRVAAEAEVLSRIAVTSPMVGVFYRSSGPDSAPYVEAGDHVDVGQIIGLIEAMKVFSEVPSEIAGTVVEFASPNGQLVRSGDPLIYLRPN